MKKNQISEIQTYLSVLYVVCLLISNIVAGKQISLPFGINMTGGIFIFPITYILSDIFSEVYGYNWSRKTCLMSVVANIFMIFIFSITIKSSYPSYWENQNAFEIVLGNVPRFVIALLASFYVGDFVNDRIFRKMKEKDKEKRFALRAIVSSLFGELLDSIIFVSIALLGSIPVEQLIKMILIQPLIKVSYEVIILPLTNLICKKLKSYECN